MRVTRSRSCTTTSRSPTRSRSCPDRWSSTYATTDSRAPDAAALASPARAGLIVRPTVPTATPAPAPARSFLLLVSLMPTPPYGRAPPCEERHTVFAAVAGTDGSGRALGAGDLVVCGVGGSGLLGSRTSRLGLRLRPLAHVGHQGVADEHGPAEQDAGDGRGQGGSSYGGDGQQHDRGPRYGGGGERHDRALPRLLVLVGHRHEDLQAKGAQR